MIEYIQSLNHQKKSSSKNFYIILKYKNDDKKIKTVDDLAIENLNDKYFKIKDCLSRCGNGVIDINNINTEVLFILNILLMILEILFGIYSIKL